MKRRPLLIVLLVLGLTLGLQLSCNSSKFSMMTWKPAKEAPAAAPVAAAAPVERIERLPNGLRVIVREQHLGGVAAFRLYITAGSLNEGEFTGAGVSHLLEHVVAEGATPTRTRDQFDEALAAIGADTNAFTSKQFVSYVGECSGTQINSLIEILSDRVVNNIIDKKDFEREFQVVQRELERAEADPDHRLEDLADENFFLNHPARTPVIGYLADLKQLTHDDVVKYYHERVSPDNAVAVAVGDFDANAVFEKIRQVLGPWERRTSLPTSLPPRQPQTAPREATAQMDVASIRMVIEYPTVQLTHPDLYPLDILAFILGEGRASRLVSDLRDQRGLVESIACASDTPAGYDGGRFQVMFQAEPQKAAAARAAVLEHLARVVKERVSADELARAKRQKASEFVFQRQACASVADDMGFNELLVGDAHFSDQYVRNIQNVTAEDVQRVAAAYFRPESLCVTSVVPTAAPTAGAKPAAAVRKRPEIYRTFLPNGVTLLFCPVEGHPTVSIQMFMKGGLSVETANDAGTSAFMARMLLKGTATHKAADIAEALDAMGAEINASAGRNTIYLSARCLAEDFQKTFDLAADSLLHPSFPPDEIERTRALVLADLAHMSDTPAGEAALYFNRVFFTDSPYQFPVSGTPETIKALSRDALVAWHKKYVASNNLVVAIFGGFKLGKDPEHVADALKALPKNPALSFPKDVAPRQVAAREVYIKPTEKQAAVVYVAYPGMDVYNVRDRFAVGVLDTILSGYQMPGDWLFKVLRGRGLVYEVQAFSMEGLRPGYVAARAVCQPQAVPEVVKIIEATLADAREKSFTEAEIEAARATVITEKELGRETLDGWAFEAAVDECLGLGFNFPREEIDRIRLVRIEDAMRVARQYLKKPVIVILTSDPAAAESVRKEPAPTEKP
jgi:zinc protease